MAITSSAPRRDDTVAPLAGEGGSRESVIDQNFQFQLLISENAVILAGLAASAAVLLWVQWRVAYVSDAIDSPLKRAGRSMRCTAADDDNLHKILEAPSTSYVHACNDRYAVMQCN